MRVDHVQVQLEGSIRPILRPAPLCFPRSLRPIAEDRCDGWHTILNTKEGSLIFRLSQQSSDDLSEQLPLLHPKQPTFKPAPCPTVPIDTLASDLSQRTPKASQEQGVGLHSEGSAPIGDDSNAHQTTPPNEDNFEPAPPSPLIPPDEQVDKPHQRGDSLAANGEVLALAMSLFEVHMPSHAQVDYRITECHAGAICNISGWDPGVERFVRIDPAW